MQLTRKSVTEVYDFIKQDLTDAIEVLPYISQYSSDEAGKASKEAAYALMANVITSYSIHYTKLYEICLRTVARVACAASRPFCRGLCRA